MVLLLSEIVPTDEQRPQDLQQNLRYESHGLVVSVTCVLWWTWRVDMQVSGVCLTPFANVYLQYGIEDQLENSFYL